MFGMRRLVLTALAACALVACAPVQSSAAQEENSPVTITLTRGACFGFCPVYRVSIRETGEVVYVGEQFVNVRGEQRAQISPDAVQSLVARFDEIGFENLQDEYRAPVSDHPTVTITLDRNGVSKTVVDYAGTGAGMPVAVRALEDEIDRVAGTAQWVLRDGQPVRERPEH
jgi:Domain of unknown function (DUF6438)